MNNNPWDSLSYLFASDDDLDKVPIAAADNILIAWPVILEFITKNTHKTFAERALDYGCGGGRFAARLNMMGYKVMGIDFSDEMIKSAREHYGPYANFESGNEQTAAEHAPFDLITSLMTFEFIADVKPVLSTLMASLAPGGIFVFAVHNPAYVRDSIQSEGSPYVDFNSSQNPTQGILRFGEVGIPIFLRESAEYKYILEPLGLKYKLERRPAFTEEFLTKYPIEGPTKNSEYLILGFRKEASVSQ